MVRDGLELEYAEQGDSSGPCVLLVHAYLDSWRSFEPLLAYLPPSIHAIAMTQRGHGGSARPSSGYRPGDLAADLDAFHAALGLPSAVLVASSSATFTVQRFAIDRPDRTAGLVLVGVPFVLSDKPGVHEMAREIRSLTDPVDGDFVRSFVTDTAGTGVDPSFVETMIAESRRVPAHVWRLMLEGLREARAPCETETIGAPTLVVWGDQDPICPRDDQEALLAAIPGAELAVHRGAGHLVHWERPAEVAADVARLVA